MKRATVLLLLALGACTSSDPDPFPSLPADPCALLSDRDVEDAMGTKVVRHAPADSHSPDGPALCEYHVGGGLGSLVVAVDPATITGFTTIRDDDIGTNKVVENLGDEAFERGEASLWVRVDEGYFVLGFQREWPDGAVHDLRTLADTALGNIPARQ